MEAWSHDMGYIDHHRPINQETTLPFINLKLKVVNFMSTALPPFLLSGAVAELQLTML
jgi:hypothetical protein